MAKKAKKIKKTTELLDQKLTNEEKAELARKAFAVSKQALYTVLFPKMVVNIDVPTYQREPIPAHVKRIREALLNGEIIPPIILAYHPEQNNGMDFETMKEHIRKMDWSVIDNVRYTVIDGLQRVTAARPIGFPICAVILPPMTDKAERAIFLALQKGRRVHSDHIISVECDTPVNKIINEMGHDANSPLKGCIYYGKGVRNPEQLHATAFAELIKRKSLKSIEHLKPFGEFYKKVFYGRKTYSGGFKSCAELWERLTARGKFDINKPEHCNVWSEVDWDSDDIKNLATKNSPGTIAQLADILYSYWEKSGYNA